MLKNFLIALFLMFSSNVFASSVSNVIDRYTDEFGSRNDMVMVVFYTSKNVDAALGNVKQLMKTKDEDALLNP